MPFSAEAQLLNVVLKLIAIGFVAMFMGFLLTPAAWEPEQAPPVSVAEVDSAPIAETEPDIEAMVTPTPVLPRAVAALNVRIGPGPNYTVIGTVPRGARLEIVGRDPTSLWLAIVFNYGSKLNGWVPNTEVTGIDDISSLPLARITFLP